MLTVNSILKAYIKYKYRLRNERRYISDICIDNEKLEMDSDAIYYSHNYLNSNSSVSYYIKNSDIYRIEYAKRFRLIVLHCKCLMHYSSDSSSYVQAEPVYKEIDIPIFDWYNPSFIKYLLEKEYTISYI